MAGDGFNDESEGIKVASKWTQITIDNAREIIHHWIRKPRSKLFQKELRMSHPQYGTGIPRVCNGVWFIRHKGEVGWHKITLNFSTDEQVRNWQWKSDIIEHYGPMDLEEDYDPIETEQRKRREMYNSKEFVDNVIFRLKEVELKLDKRLTINDEFWSTTKKRIEELEKEIPRLKKILTDLAGKESVYRDD